MRANPYSNATEATHLLYEYDGGRHVHFSDHDEVQYYEPSEAGTLSPRDGAAIERIVRNTPYATPKPQAQYKVVPVEPKVVKRLKTIAHLCVYFTLASAALAPLMGPAAVVPIVGFLATMIICGIVADRIMVNQRNTAKEINHSVYDIDGVRTLDLRGFDLKNFKINVNNFVGIDEVMIDKEQMYELLKKI